MTTFAQVLSVSQAVEGLSEEDLDLIASKEAIGQKLDTEIAAMSDVELAQLLHQNELFGTLRICGGKASKLLDLPAIKRLSENQQSVQAVTQAPQFPTSIKLEADKTPQQMKLVELLLELVKNPSDTELKSELMSRPTVVKATSVVGLRFGFKKSSGEFDADSTLQFINNIDLGKPAQRKVNGLFPILLDSALGLVSIVWFNPLLKGEKLYEGLDYENDMDWNTVPEKNREAVMWSRVTLHKNFPASPDVWTEFDAIVVGTGRWKNIIEDYDRHLEEGGEKVSIKYTEGVEEIVEAFQAASGAQSAKKPVTGNFVPDPTEPYYLQIAREKLHCLNIALVTENQVAVKYQLQAQIADTQKMIDDWTKPSKINQSFFQHSDPLALLRAVSEGSYQVGGARATQKCVCDFLSAGGASKVDKVIALNGGSGSGASQGTVYVPHGVRFDLSGVSSIKVLKRSPEELYALAQSWDLV
jgi:hypothetical protein